MNCTSKKLHSLYKTVPLMKIIDILKPHAMAIALAFLVLFAYFPSVFLESKVINMSDINRSSSTSKQIRDYRDQTGEEPLWAQSQFSGMPAYQMNVKYPKNIVKYIGTFTMMNLPSKLGLIFVMFIGFYFLSYYLGVKTWLSIVGAFAFAFSSFFIISLEAGHTGKLRAIGLMAPVLLGVILTMRGKLWLGGVLTSLSVALAISANHYQITYYLLLMILIYIIVETVHHIRDKQWKSLVVKGVILAFAALIGVGPNISQIWTTLDYSKETMRDGKSELSSYKDAKGGGLEKDYAMSWSYGIAESFTVLIPDLYGGSSMGSLESESNTADDLRRRGVPKAQLNSILKRLPLYWGDQPFTSGPVYFGATVIFLFILSLFVLHGRLKIWLICCTILSFILAWGENFPLVNDFFFYYFPLYNKFRTPSMILSIAALTVPLMAVMGLNKILSSNHGVQSFMPEIKKAFYITAGLCLIFVLFGSAFFSFSGQGDGQLPEGWPIDALIEDRKHMLTMSAMKSLIIISITFALLWAFARNKLSPRLFIGGIILCVVVDLWIVDKKYLNDDNLVKRTNRDDFYVNTPADNMILQDPDPHFRVFNVSVNPFTDAYTSFHHHSIGGYHGAKLIRYQDMINEHLSKNNTQVIDMLNTRYYIVKDEKNNQDVARRNPGALGNAWFVDTLIWVPNADEEIKALNEFKPASEAIIDERYIGQISDGLYPNSGSSSIQLTSFTPNELKFNANAVGGDQFAVFSEVYYEGTDNDWKTFIDGKPANHIRVNYILRGMEIPEGKHEIVFRFEPISYFLGEKISLAFSILLLAMVVGVSGTQAIRYIRKTNDTVTN